MPQVPHHAYEEPLQVEVIVEPALRLSRVPVAWLSREQKAQELQRTQAEEARIAAAKAELVLGMAADSRAESPDGEVDEFFVDELALVLNCSRAAATSLYEQARTLAERLPAVWAALQAGELDWPRARALAVELGEPADGTDPAIVAAVEAAVLPQAASLSIRRLREAARAELLARDAAAAERRRKSVERAADVVVRPLPDGRAELVSGHRADRAAAMREMVDRLAWMLRKDGDQRPIGVLRAEVHEQLVLRPSENVPSVTAQLAIVAPLAALGATVTAPGPAPTATVNGMPITAGHLRELLAELDADGMRAPAGGTLDIALVDDAGRLRATVTDRQLRRLVSRGCPTHAPADRKRRRRRGGRASAADPGTATDSTDAASDPGESCGCAVLDSPPEVGRYRPTPAQYRFVRTRDRTCRHPGCGNPAGWADADHVVPHADGGRTDCANLTILCLVKPPPRSFRGSATKGYASRAGRPSGRRRPRGRRSA